MIPRNTNRDLGTAAMTGETILIVEDDATLLRVLKDRLELDGFRALVATDGQRGFAEAVQHQPDLIILDIMLPRMNGFELCRMVRRHGLEMPIIMLTAKDREGDIVHGLHLGADDYVTKPFSVNELLARTTAFLRRRRAVDREVYEFGDCTFDLAAHKLSRGGQEIPLAPKEFGLLAFFVRSAGRALTREEILRSVWGAELLVTTRSVDRCVTTLRHKIEPDPHAPVFITTIRDIGYRFELSDEGEPEFSDRTNPP